MSTSAILSLLSACTCLTVKKGRQATASKATVPRYLSCSFFKALYFSFSSWQFDPNGHRTVMWPHGH